MSAVAETINPMMRNVRVKLHSMKRIMSSMRLSPAVIDILWCSGSARDLRGPGYPALLRNWRAAEMICHDLEGGQALAAPLAPFTISKPSRDNFAGMGTEGAKNGQELRTNYPR